MEEPRRKRRYERDFKLGAVKMVVEQGRSVRSVAQDLGIDENTLHHWKKKYLQDREHAFPGKGYQKPEDAELTALRKENAKLRESNAILKKAAAYFAQHVK